MTSNLPQMTNQQLKQYISENRNNAEAFRSALTVLLSRRDPASPYQPYPFDLADPENEVRDMLRKKLEQGE
ncbi:MAG: hypothetical protein SFW36_06735 [Leptolyngbyaceae cyanobacterium bins.59]|nr:hypothetical protein [Leptolyngbyaceae cyanobacterium bins.59]